MWGINIAEPAEVVRDFAGDFGLSFPILLGGADIKNLYSISDNTLVPFPRDFIIGRDGRLVYVSQLFDPEEIGRVIAAELARGGGEQAEPGELGFTLQASYPNPIVFGAEAATIAIEYSTEADSEITLNIYSAAGQLVRRLVSERRAAGVHSDSWDGRNESGARVASGVYIVRLGVAGQAKTRLISVVR